MFSVLCHGILVISFVYQASSFISKGGYFFLLVFRFYFFNLFKTVASTFMVTETPRKRVHVPIIYDFAPNIHCGYSLEPRFGASECMFWREKKC